MCKTCVNKNQSSFTIWTQIPLIIPLSHHFSSLFYPFAVHCVDCQNLLLSSERGGQGHTMAFLFSCSPQLTGEKAFPLCPTQKQSTWPSNTTSLHPTTHHPTSCLNSDCPIIRATQHACSMLYYTDTLKRKREGGKKRRTDVQTVIPNKQHNLVFCK